MSNKFSLILVCSVTAVTCCIAGNPRLRSFDDMKIKGEIHSMSILGDSCFVLHEITSGKNRECFNVLRVANNWDTTKCLWSDSVLEHRWELQPPQLKTYNKSLWIVDHSGVRLIYGPDTIDYSNCVDSIRPSVKVNPATISSAFVTGARSIENPKDSVYTMGLVQEWTGGQCVDKYQTRNVMTTGIPVLVASKGSDTVLVSFSYSTTNGWAPLRTLDGVPHHLDGIDNNSQVNIVALLPTSYGWFLVIEKVPPYSIVELDHSFNVRKIFPIYNGPSEINGVDFTNGRVCIAVDSGVAVFNVEESESTWYPRSELFRGLDLSILSKPKQCLWHENQLYVRVNEGIVSIDAISSVYSSQIERVRINDPQLQGTELDVSQFTDLRHCVVNVSSLDGYVWQFPVLARNEARSVDISPLASGVYLFYTDVGSLLFTILK